MKLLAVGIKLAAGSSLRKENIVRKRYRITNIETGEILEGGAAELAEKIGITVKGFYNAELCKFKACGVWDIEKFEEGTKKQHGRHIPPELWRMWDEVTEPFKRYICRRNDEREQYKADNANSWGYGTCVHKGI